MLLRFTKMQGLGNDFVMLDLITQRFNLTEDHVRHLADRRFGVGCDQVLVVDVPRQPDVDFGYRIYNADGGEVEQCGNGARCLARFVSDKKLTGKNRIRVATRTSVMDLKLTRDGQVRVNMGKPVLDPEQIPFQAESRATCYELDVAGTPCEISAVSMGNPHSVMVIDDIESDIVSQLGPVIESHPRFPRRANAGFMQLVSRREINLRVYERGAGETLACGSGACAAVVAGQLRGLLEQHVTVNLRGGSLTVEWRGEGHPVMMTGPATTVFEGQIHL